METAPVEGTETQNMEVEAIPDQDPNLAEAQTSEAVAEEAAAAEGGEAGEAEEDAEPGDIEVPQLPTIDDPNAQAEGDAEQSEAAATEEAATTEATGGDAEQQVKKEGEKSVAETKSETATTPSGKRRGRPPGSKNSKKARLDALGDMVNADNVTWDNLLGQVRFKLRHMTSDECFVKALELQLLARSEVEARSTHLSTAMDIMTQSGVHNSKRGRGRPKSTGGMLGDLQGTPKQLEAMEKSTKRQIKTTRETKERTLETVPCIKLLPPFPPKCEPDPRTDHLEAPDFRDVVNFPTARYFSNCVMCDEKEHVIPKQNKGVCNSCDVAVWIVRETGMQLKWCKGCKNFRKWIDFGVKGYSSKCERCRTQQAERYAQQREKLPSPALPTSV